MTKVVHCRSSTKADKGARDAELVTFDRSAALIEYGAPSQSGAKATVGRTCSPVSPGGQTQLVVVWPVHDRQPTSEGFCLPFSFRIYTSHRRAGSP